LTVAEPEPLGFSAVVMFDGQVIARDWVLLTVTLKPQGSPDSPAQETLVAPSGKNEPDGGLHATEPQSPLLVGAE